jgi:hypothetical protein
LDGVTSSVQTQIDGKAALSSPAFTGTPTAPTATTGTNTTQLATTAFVQQAAFNNTLPSQTGNAGKFVTTDGTNASWANAGSVTSVDVSGGTTGLTTSGGPITGSGTITLAGTLGVANGGTGATTLTGVVKGNGTSPFTTGAVALGSEVSGTLPVANGGTGATTLAANNVLLGNGTSAMQAVAPGAAGNLLTSNGTTWASTAPAPSGPTLTAIASGSLSDGSRVVVNADGTVSVVAAVTQAVGSPTVFRSASTSDISATYDSAAQRVVIAHRGNSNFGTAIVGTVSGTSISFGAPVVFRSAFTSDISATYDSAAQRVVIAYRDGGNSNFGTAIVGTVSGTSIGFGTAVVFRNAGITRISATYDSAAQRVVIAYADNSDFGIAIVGAVSGTSISFGTAVVFNNASTSGISATYDSAAQRVVIAYQNVDMFAIGTARVGTVSGTSITFGTPVVFRDGSSSFNISTTYDANAQRVVIAYADGGTSGIAIVGTVSGTSISFGAPVVFRSASTGRTSVTYDSNAQRVVIAYVDGGNSFFGTAIVGTVSGTSISFGNPVVFESAGTDFVSTTYDANAQRVVIAYQDADSSNFGTSVVFRNASTNAQSFIGFSNAAYTNGQTATIQIAGSVDDAQSGLIPGRAYFVQGNGTLGLTPVTPSVFAGTAVAANRIIVKG